MPFVNAAPPGMIFVTKIPSSPSTCSFPVTEISFYYQKCQHRHIMIRLKLKNNEFSVPTPPAIENPKPVLFFKSCTSNVSLISLIVLHELD